MIDMTIDEAIAHAREVAKRNREQWKNCPADRRDIEHQTCEQCAEEHEQLAEWLEELKELRTYKERIEMQYLDDVDNPLEPLKLQSALQSEIFKYNYRKEHKPQDINILDILLVQNAIRILNLQVVILLEEKMNCQMKLELFKQK